MKTERYKKIINSIFIVLFVGMLFYPFLRLDTTGIIDSETENRRLTMWPGFFPDGSYNEWYGHYVEDRVAFREDAVRIYTNAVYKVFGEFAEDLHMYGKEGEIFPASAEYVAAYQNLATDEELIDSLVTYLERTDRYLKQKQIPFIFMAGLDKKTVYGEYMPDYIHVDENGTGVMDYLAGRLDEKGVAYVIPVDAFREAATRDEERIYNRLADTAHWNANGMMLGMSLLNTETRRQQQKLGTGQIAAYETDWFTPGRGTTGLEFLSLPVTEEIPTWTLKEEFLSGVHEEEGFIDTVPHIEGPYAQHLISDNARTDQKLLIFGDSFMQNNMQYLLPQYRDIYSFGRQNYENMQYYVEMLQPDVVVFENAERAFVDDLYNYTNLSSVQYP